MTFHLKHSKKFILSVFCMCLSLLVLPGCLWADQILQPIPPPDGVELVQKGISENDGYFEKVMQMNN